MPEGSERAFKLFGKGYDDERKQATWGEFMRPSEQKYGQAVLKWQPDGEGGYRGAVILGGKRLAVPEDADEERLLTRLRNEAGRLHPDYVGFDGAIRRYLHFFPDGLSGAANATSERNYKKRAAERLLAAAPLERAAAATAEDAAHLASAGIQTNMLSPFEALDFGTRS